MIIFLDDDGPGLAGSVMGLGFLSARVHLECSFRKVSEQDAARRCREVHGGGANKKPSHLFWVVTPNRRLPTGAELHSPEAENETAQGKWGLVSECETQSHW